MSNKSQINTTQMNLENVSQIVLGRVLANSKDALEGVKPGEALNYGLNVAKASNVL